MAEHNTLTGTSLHEPKDVATATSGQVYVADGGGSGTWTTQASDNSVLVNSSSDFPTPTMVGGVSSIVLEDKEYLINTDFSMTTPLAYPGTGNRATIKSINRAVLTYTGTDAMFRDTDALGDIEIDGLTQFESPNAPMFALTAVSGTWSFQAKNGPKFTNCTSLGTLDGGASGNGSFNVFFGTFSDFDAGLTATNLFFFEINTMFCFGNNVASTTYFTVTGANSSGSINFFSNTFGNGSNETAFDFDPTIETPVDSINLIGNHVEGGVNGVVFDAASLDLDSGKINSTANDGLIANTTSDGLLSFKGNATATTISSTSTDGTSAVVIAGTWVEADVQQFTSTAGGRLTYNGIKDIRVPVDGIINAITATGTDDVGLYLAKNGTAIENSGIVQEVQAVDPTHIPMVWQVSMVTGDYLELMVENQTDTDDITVQRAVFRVN